MRQATWILIVALVSAATSAGTSFYLNRQLAVAAADAADTAQHAQSTTQTRAARNDDIVALGRMEPAKGVVDVGALAGDRLEKIFVSEGATVEAGTELALLASHALRAAEVALAQAQLDDALKREESELMYAEALKKEALVAVKQSQMLDLDIAAQQKKIDALEANWRLLQEDQERMESASAALTSSYDRRHHGMLVQQAATELAGARALLEKLEKTAPLSVEQANAQLSAADAGLGRVSSTLQLDSLRQSLELAKLRQSQAIVKAPTAGTVLKVLGHEGEVVSTRPILRLGDTSAMFILAEVYEDEVHRVQLQAEASATSDAIPGKILRGVVERIGSAVARNEVVSLDPTARADTRIVEVRIALDKASSQACRAFVNLQVEVRIRAAAPSQAKPRAATNADSDAGDKSQ